jgi:hypothetical protein
VVARVDGRSKDKAKQRSHHSVGLAHGARLAQDEMLQLAGLKWEPSREPWRSQQGTGPGRGMVSWWPPSRDVIQVVVL